MKKNGSANADELRRHSGQPDESFDGHDMVVSATECTGLAPAITDADGGMLSAQANEARLYAVHAPLEKGRPAGTEDESDGRKDRKNRKDGKNRQEEKRTGDGH